MRLRTVLSIAALSMLAALSLAPADAAQNYSLFVRRTFVNSHVQGGQVFAPADELLKAMGYEWSQNGDTLELKSGKAGGPDIRSRQITLSYNGAAINPSTLFLKNKIYVGVRQVAESLGGTYIETPSAGVAQVVFPSSRISQQDLDRAVRAAANRPAPAVKPTTTDVQADVKTDAKTDAKDDTKTDATGDTKTDVKDDAKPSAEDEAKAKAEEEKRKNPLAAEVTNLYNPYIPGSSTPAEVHGTFTVKNTSDEPVKKINLQVIILDLGGNEVASVSTANEYIAELAGGQEIKRDFMWTNYYNYQISAKVKVEHEPLPEKKKADDKK